MKKDSMILLAVLAAFALLLAACGPAATPTGAATADSRAPETRTEAPATESQAGTTAEAAPGTEPSAEPETDSDEAETEPVEPAAPGGEAYAWLGMQEMPRCAYVDALASGRYYREYLSMSMGYHTETAEAVDGVNTFLGTDTTRTYSVDGRLTGINDSARQYWERDDPASGGEAADELLAAMGSGENLTGRAFSGTGREPIPQYGSFFDDETEYEYYEYRYPAEEEMGLTKIERFYMKNGDVFAIYRQTVVGDETVESVTELIRSVSGELPAGVFDIPELDGYEKS